MRPFIIVILCLAALAVALGFGLPNAAETAAAEVETHYETGRKFYKGLGVAQDDTEAAKWFGKAAEKGHPKAQTVLGYLYDEGRGVAEDNEEAVRLYRQAADQDYAPAQRIMGKIYYEGLAGVAPDDELAVSWFGKAAEQGNAEAQFSLAYMYSEGRGVIQNDAEAVKLYRRSAEQGNKSALTNLGFMYSQGRGVEQSYEDAVSRYREAAEAGFASAQYELGKMYDNGRGVEKDAEEASRLYRKAGEQGHAKAQNTLGLKHFRAKFKALREDATVNYDNNERAAYWFRKAAEQGDAEGQYNLSLMYAEAFGAKISEEEALAWHIKAAEQGHIKAQFYLAYMYEEGRRLLAIDLEKAAYWIRKAAEQGYHPAQNELGDYYAKGRGVEKDIEKAAYWLSKAAEQDNPHAKKKLDLLLHEDDFTADINTTGVLPTDGTAVSGVLDFNGDDDWFALNVKEGQLYHIELGSGPSPDNRDEGAISQAYLTISLYDSAGDLITSSDNNFTLLFTATETGVVYVELKTNRSYSRTGNYHFMANAVDDDFADDVNTDGVLTVNDDPLTGRINFGGDHDWFYFYLVEGEIYNISTTRKDVRNDMRVKLYDSAGKLVINNHYPSMEFEAKDTGDYFIALEGYPYGTYGVGGYELKAISRTQEGFSDKPRSTGVFRVEEY